MSASSIKSACNSMNTTSKMKTLRAVSNPYVKKKPKWFVSYLSSDYVDNI